MRKSRWVLLVALVALAGVTLADDGGYTEPRVTAESRTMPEYPPAALAAGYSGTVSVAAMVNSDGSVGAVEVLESTRPGLGFESAALAAIKNWQFRPAEIDGKTVDSVGAFIFRFESVGRISPASRVGSEFAMSLAIPGGIGGAGGKGQPEFMGNAGFNPTLVRLQDMFTKPRLPPVGLGGMYNRDHLLPPQQRVVGRQEIAQ